MGVYAKVGLGFGNGNGSWQGVFLGLTGETIGFINGLIENAAGDAPMSSKLCVINCVYCVWTD